MRKLLGIASALAIVGGASAAPNFNQDPLTGNNAWGGIGDFSFQDDLIIDDNTYNISSITVFEYWGDGDVYTLNLLSGYDGAVMNSWSVGNGGGFFNGNGMFQVTYNTTGLTLGPGTYVLNFQASSAAFGGAYYWYNADLNAVNGNEAYVTGFGNSSSWSGESFDMSWQIEGTAVPEPATMAVLGLGAAALLRRRRK